MLSLSVSVSSSSESAPRRRQERVGGLRSSTISCSRHGVRPHNPCGGFRRRLGDEPELTDISASSIDLARTWRASCDGFFGGALASSNVR